MTDDLTPELAVFASLLDSQPTQAPAKPVYRLPVSGNTSGHWKSCGAGGCWMTKSKG
jgi:hypothetical protein